METIRTYRTLATPYPSGVWDLYQKNARHVAVRPTSRDRGPLVYQRCHARRRNRAKRTNFPTQHPKYFSISLVRLGCIRDPISLNRTIPVAAMCSPPPICLAKACTALCPGRRTPLAPSSFGPRTLFLHIYSHGRLASWGLVRSWDRASTQA